MKLTPGTPVTFAGLSATVVSYYPDGPYPRVRLQYGATGNRETVAADAVRPTYQDSAQIVASMITWLDQHQHEDMHPSIREALAAEDPRTWAEVHAAGVVTDGDVISAWLSSQATS